MKVFAMIQKLTQPSTLLHLEGGVLLAMSALLYGWLGGNWWLFALLLLAPDLSMIGYLAGKEAGATVYNAFHNYLLPAVLAAVGLFTSNLLFDQLAFIWLAHIGMDRLLGFGLKYASDFKDTHLGRV